jgi:hypothetical protein
MDNYGYQPLKDQVKQLFKPVQGTIPPPVPLIKNSYDKEKNSYVGGLYLGCRIIRFCTG